ncbi:hypothetical protein [Methylobacterium sp. CM6257]
MEWYILIAVVLAAVAAQKVWDRWKHEQRLKLVREANIKKIEHALLVLSKTGYKQNSVKIDNLGLKSYSFSKTIDTPKKILTLRCHIIEFAKRDVYISLSAENHIFRVEKKVVLECLNEDDLDDMESFCHYKGKSEWGDFKLPSLVVRDWRQRHGYKEQDDLATARRVLATMTKEEQDLVLRPVEKDKPKTVWERIGRRFRKAA